MGDIGEEKEVTTIPEPDWTEPAPTVPPPREPERVPEKPPKPPEREPVKTPA